jgi:hypothetical protein
MIEASQRMSGKHNPIEHLELRIKIASKCA